MSIIFGSASRYDQPRSKESASRSVSRMSRTDSPPVSGIEDVGALQGLFVTHKRLLLIGAITVIMSLAVCLLGIMNGQIFLSVFSGVLGLPVGILIFGYGLRFFIPEDT